MTRMDVIDHGRVLGETPDIRRLREQSDEVERLVEEHTDGRGLGFLGEPGVNVLELNLAVATAGGD